MKKTLAALVLFALTGSAASAAPFHHHHRVQVCRVHRHHRVCTWR